MQSKYPRPLTIFKTRGHQRYVWPNWGCPNSMVGGLAIKKATFIASAMQAITTRAKTGRDSALAAQTAIPWRAFAASSAGMVRITLPGYQSCPLTCLANIYFWMKSTLGLVACRKGLGKRPGLFPRHQVDGAAPKAGSR